MSLVNDALEESDASLETILALMQREDFDIDFQEPRCGNTPLLAAIFKHREDVALEIIQRSANVELANHAGTTPLILACAFNLQSTAHALVEAGTDINRAQDWTPLGYAAYHGHLSMVRKMLSWGADPNGMGTRQKTVRAEAKFYGNVGVVKFLDACGAILLVRSAEEVRRVATRSALKRLPKDMGRLVGEMLM
jgi:ankyrin repeat protein